ncbi:hypothetical protein [Candidatus Palauibacter sp.]|uniref:hypothetical protein n=1 Tax=Candidatus Palauibacter sp. TaxID=3101350 RepID=UPI003B016680
MGRITKCSGGTKAHEAAEGIPCVRYGDLYTYHGSSITDTRSFVSPEYSGNYSRIRYGDVLFAASGETMEEIGKSSVNLLGGETLCGGDVILLRPTIPVSARFLGYATNAPYVVHQKSRLGRGMTVMHIYGKQLKNVAMLLPPVLEQRSIADFLDVETTTIDALVIQQERLLDLLHEKRTALISHVVTKGLDPDIPKKDSGVDWLGRIPAHWEVQRLGAIGRIRKCSGGTKAHEVAEGIPCVRYGDLYTYHGFSITETRSSVSPEHSGSYSRIRYGDLLFAASGETIEEIGKSSVNLLGGEALCGGDVILLRPTIPVSARFLGYATNAPYVVHQKSGLGRGMTVMHIYGKQLRDAALLLPPVTEQRALANFIELETSKIDCLTEEIRGGIGRLKEYRTALISAAVTGKIDVRGESASAEESECSNAEACA